ncbi:MAG: PKD domain-containing protein [bacterium]|nr:PKD domain-containing protein [bacterium]
MVVDEATTGRYYLEVTGTGNGPFVVSVDGESLLEGSIMAGETRKIVFDYLDSGNVAGEVTDFPPEGSIAPFFGEIQLGAPLQVVAVGIRDVDGQVVSVDWSFGDGTSLQGDGVEHVYSVPGSYTVSLSVSDDAGNTTVETANVVVIAPPDPPPSGPPSIKMAVSVGDDIIPTGPFGAIAARLTRPAGFRLSALVGNPGASGDSTWTWSWGDGTSTVTASGQGTSGGGLRSGAPPGFLASGATHNYLDPGEYDLTVTYDDGVRDPVVDQSTVTVLAPDLEPAGRFSFGSGFRSFSPPGFPGVSAVCPEPGAMLSISGTADVRFPISGGWGLGLAPLDVWLGNRDGVINGDSNTDILGEHPKAAIRDHLKTGHRTGSRPGR